MAITIKRARQVVELCTDLSLYEEYHAAASRFDAAKQTNTIDPRETGSVELREAGAEVQRLEALMAGAKLSFTLEAVDRIRWNTFCAEHPPKEEDEASKAQGVDLDSLDELFPESIKSVHDSDGNPYDFDPKSEWKALSTDLSDGQWSDFVSALLTVNRGSKAPKSLAVSLAMRGSEQS